MFGNQGGNANAPNNCLTYANVSGSSACLVGGATTFVPAQNSLMFGPLPTAATISNLLANTDNSAAGQTVTVLDDGATTLLSCTTTAASPLSCSDSTDSVVIPAGDYLEVQIANGSGSWRTTFRLG